MLTFMTGFKNPMPNTDKIRY